jgi:hypothetical protein
MKRAGLRAIAVGAVAGAGLVAMNQACAGEKDHATRCTLATLNGQYLFTGSGTLFPPVFGVTKQSIGNSAGFHVFNGDGTGTDFVTFSVNGIVVVPSSSAPITYTLKPDCTGTLSVQNGPNLDIFVAVDGSALTSINTDPGVAFSEGPQPRVGLDQ